MDLRTCHQAPGPTQWKEVVLSPLLFCGTCLHNMLMNMILKIRNKNSIIVVSFSSQKKEREEGGMKGRREGGEEERREGGTYFTRSNTSFQKYKPEATKAFLVEKKMKLP